MLKIARKKISEHLIEILGGKCKVCQSIENLEIDHIKALCLGGKDIVKNLQILCKPCHVKKTIKDRKLFSSKWYTPLLKYNKKGMKRIINHLSINEALSNET